MAAKATGKPVARFLVPLGLPTSVRQPRADIRAERRAGELLTETSKNGHRATKGKPQKMSQRATLTDHGSSKDQSSDWQNARPVHRIVGIGPRFLPTKIPKIRDGVDLQSARSDIKSYALHRVGHRMG